MENDREMARKRRHRLHRCFHRRSARQETEYSRPSRLSGALHQRDERSRFDSGDRGRPAGQSGLVRIHSENQTSGPDSARQGADPQRKLAGGAAEELRDTNFEVYNHSYQRGQRRK